ncbi:hypothetical protein [Micromonospora aurantiaca (nom. illeg.)]|uniref:hypothetical protein n=1 Tax=Micromonospora aurantiaca (nom. illeg.) TaxID=47850 RepID=UPI0011A3D610
MTILNGYQEQTLTAYNTDGTVFARHTRAVMYLGQGGLTEDEQRAGVEKVAAFAEAHSLTISIVDDPQPSLATDYWLES